MEEILHHLGCIKPVINWINYLSTGAGSLPLTVSSLVNTEHLPDSLGYLGRNLTEFHSEQWCFRTVELILFILILSQMDSDIISSDHFMACGGGLSSKIISTDSDAEAGADTVWLLCSKGSAER